MRLNANGLRERGEWERAGFVLPRFDLEKVKAETRKSPGWIHFGAGNIFRVFPAARMQKLLDDGIETAGLIVAEGFDYEIIDAVFVPHDNLSLAVTLKADGSIDKTVIASVTEALRADSRHPDFERLREIFRAPGLKMASFTITEKGYLLRRGPEYAPEVAADFREGPARPESYLGKVAALLYERFRAGRLPLAMCSLDNCSHNGDRLGEAMAAFAGAWTRAGLAEAGFAGYVGNPAEVSFPWSMIDKITPRPDEGVRKMLLEAGFEDVETAVTAKNTHVAPFVNAEETEYLVIEDSFPNGRPALDRAGVVFTGRDTVDRVEKMKVGTCLNPLHTALAIFGCLLSFTKISEEMRDPDLRRLVEKIGYDEGLPVVSDPGIVDPRDFLRQCLEVRFPNPFMPDTPQRIACDTSQKLPVRFGETIKAYLARPDLEAGKLRLIPLVFAGWCRYLLGVDDRGAPFERSPDPLLPALDKRLAGIRLGDRGSFHEALAPILSDPAIFGVDLYGAGLGERVEEAFGEMAAGAGAVRETLRKYLS
ncbi:MAG: mannitol dehydrogenase family protein [Planctomycetota bacterium]|jgi:fructuronate reductase|nr:mannitol dehydrogenase family protein [Planctomycetota bacterium]